MSAHPAFRICLALDRTAMLSCSAQTINKVRALFGLAGRGTFFLGQS